MEWVETTAKTVDEAKDLLLDQLGVDEQEAEFDVLEEPRPGMFGRLRGLARVRARVVPKTPPQKDERRRRSSGDSSKKKSESTSENGSPSKDRESKGRSGGDKGRSASAGGRNEGRGAQKESTPAAATRPDRDDAPALSVEDASADITSFLDEFTKRFEVDADVSIEISDEGELMVALTGNQLGRLIGPKGAMMTALEELCRTRLQHRAAGGDRPRLRLDVGGYREARRENLRQLVAKTVEDVRTTGTPHIIDVVNASERKVIHDTVAETASDMTTSSEGEDPVRRVVIATA